MKLQKGGAFFDILNNIQHSTLFVPFTNFFHPNDSYLAKKDYLCTEISIKYVFVMARPIKETHILYGEDARRLQEPRRREASELPPPLFPLRTDDLRSKA